MKKEKLNFEQITDILYAKYDKYDFEHLEDEFDEDLGKIEMVNQEGGEGKGEYYEIVNHFIDYDVYIKLIGWYSSYDGVDFSGNDYEEVIPKQKTITVYESI